MRKYAYFDSQSTDDGWPAPKDIEHYFLAPPGQRWFCDTGNDSAGLYLEGVDGTEQLPRGRGGRIDIKLSMWGHPTLGVLLIWSKWDGKRNHNHSSKGDLTRLRELVNTTHGDPMP